MKARWFVILILLIFISYLIHYNIIQSDDLEISFLSIGQGDSILIETKEGLNILIDTSAGEVVLREMSKQLNYLEKNIDLLILTHADLDHIGGTPSVFDRYEVSILGYHFDFNESELTEYIYEKTNEEEIDLLKLNAGDVINIGDLEIKILWPVDGYEDDKNEMSVVTLITYFDNKILLTGDAGIEVEEKLINMYPEIQNVDLLKLGHHGSKTSSSKEFLEYTNPEVVVVSAGEGNKFGHPHEEVIERVESLDIDIKTTMSGTIIFNMDNRGRFWIY